MEPIRITAATVREAVRGLRQSAHDRERVRGSVADIVQMVRDGGDAAVRRLTARYDGVEVERARMTRRTLRKAMDDTPRPVLEALETLAENLRTTSVEMMPRPTRQVLPQGQIVSTRPIGMGYRSCIDLVTLFAPTEGMLVGSTSQGGILCCPEVFHLPYMDLRPFRVNAGTVAVVATGNTISRIRRRAASRP